MTNSTTAPTLAYSRRSGADLLPGDIDPATLVERIVRVDHAGEYGARRIYEGQLAVLPRGSTAARQIRHMAEQERTHLDAFSKTLGERRIRPTALLPVWHVAGFALGAATALLGERAAMACTIAVEDVIEEHYARQSAQLGPDEAKLKAEIDQFRDDEIEHKDIAEEAGGRELVGYPVLSRLVRAGSKLAIFLSERV